MKKKPNRQHWLDYRLKIQAESSIQKKLESLENRILKAAKKPTSKPFRLGVRAVLVNLAYARKHSNTNNHVHIAYTTRSPQLKREGAPCGANTLRTIINVLSEQKYVDNTPGHNIKLGESKSSEPSRLVTTRKFNKIITIEDSTDLHFFNAESQGIQVKDRAGNIVFGDEATSAWHDYDLRQINSVNSDAAIYFGKTRIMVGKLKRVFNSEDYDKGGRFYGDEYQSLSKSERSELTINGERTAEIDFPSIHPTILYSEMGLTPPPDTYHIMALHLAVNYGPHERWRRVAKLATLIAINARNKSAASKALATKLRQRKISISVTASEVLESISKACNEISSKFYNDEGVRLQRADAEIANEIMMYFTDSTVGPGKPILCVHDSFIVRERDKDELIDLMQYHYDQLTMSSAETYDDYLERRLREIPTKVVHAIRKTHPRSTSEELVNYVDSSTLKSLIKLLA